MVAVKIIKLVKDVTAVNVILMVENVCIFIGVIFLSYSF